MQATPPYHLPIEVSRVDPHYQVFRSYMLFFRDENDIVKQCRKEFYGFPKLRIEGKIKLPPKGEKLILDVLLSNYSMEEVDYPAGFFTPSQTKKLSYHLEANKKRRNHLFGKFYGVIIQHFRFSALMLLGSSIGFALFFFGLGSSVPFNILIGALGGLVMALVYIPYQRFAASFYNTPKKISQISSSWEHDALLTGLKAKNVDRYVKSFFKLSTYCHPISFAAGVYFRQTDQYLELKKQIKDHKTHPNEGLTSKESNSATSSAINPKS